MDVHRVSVGDVLKVGRLGGKVGTGTVSAIANDAVEMGVNLDGNPPKAPAVTLLLAMPRPKCFRRVLQTIVTLGIKRLAIFGAYRVEKSYWSSPGLSEEAMWEQVILGLEQAGDTVPPVISIHRHFKPFAQDTVPEISKGSRCMAAHPASSALCPAQVSGAVTLAIGPEGGFTTYETVCLQEAGFEMVSAGSRILRVEQVVPYLMGRILLGQ